jgi:hypothetical protein
MEEECALPAALSLYVHLVFPEKRTGFPVSGPVADEDAGGGWRRVEWDDVVGVLTARYAKSREGSIKSVRIRHWGVGVKGYCPAIRVDALEAHLI